ncbi:hypothetical Protein YC6258_02184 [Gynuella sunshinyii YC6258]|uniref:Uncharacterized protein n=1 Tax=Gynuella sunshinyii YC6258 TaxID=1445510 RepID=A0A0C5VHU6_9GAMM|nr:hypothetical Protein YC6258_02184 [Gynuella sunshinyii YC6258]
MCFITHHHESVMSMANRLFTKPVIREQKIDQANPLLMTPAID